MQSLRTGIERRRKVLQGAVRRLTRQREQALAQDIKNESRASGGSDEKRRIPGSGGCDYRSDPGVYRRGCIYGIFPVFRNTYKTPIKNLVKVMEDQDTDAALALIPERYLKVMEGVTGMDSDELADMLEDELISGFDEYTGDIKVDYDIGDTRDLTDSEIQSLGV